MQNPSCKPDIKKWVSCPLEQLFDILKTNPDGLTTAEVDQRFEQYGRNVLPEKKKHRLYLKVFTQFKNLFNILLLIAAVLSFIIGWSANDISSYQMGFAIIAVVLVSVFFNLFQEHRAERAIEAIRSLVPMNVKILRDGQTKQIAFVDIVPGDIISLEEGDKIPADARVINGYELSVDNSTLTGESEPQPRTSDVSEGNEKREIIDCTNVIFAGTTIASGSATAVVFATGSNTEFGRIVAMTQTVEEPPSPLQIEINHMAKISFTAAIGIGILFLAIAYFSLHLPFSDSILFMIGVMVCLVPEGLQITVTLSLALSSLAMSKRHVIVKRLSSVETLGSTTVICTDKTGTITTGQMTVRKIWMGGHIFDVTGEGYEPEGSIFLDGKKITTADRSDFSKLSTIAALDNKATLVPPLDRRRSRWTAIGDSTDAALLVLAAKAEIQYKQALIQQPRVALIPFESTRKMMTSIHKNTNGKLTAYVKGAGLEILSRCTSIHWNEQVVSLTPELSTQIRDQIDSFARQAYRVLALAVRDLPTVSQKYDSSTVENNLTFVGLVAIYDPPRHDVPNAVQKAQNAGIRIVMMTGDHEFTAEAIARKVGIITSKSNKIITGYKLAEISDNELDRILDTPDLVFARITPEQKLRIVRILRSKGETVAVTGDGANDAPALLEADIGIAMGISGTDVARESADMVLLDDNFASIVNGIEEGRSVFDNLKKFNVYVFSHNWAELVTFIAFVLLQTPLPLAVIGVLAIDLILEIPPSLSLTLEPPEPGIMDRNPRKKESRLFDIGSLSRSGYIGLFIGIIALFWCFTIWSQTGWHIGQTSLADQTAYLKGTTMVLVGIMAGQLGMLLATRTNIQSTFTLSLKRNKWLLIAIGAELLILVAIVYVPFLGPIFRTTSITPLEWLLLYSIVPIVILIEESRKLILRRYILPTRTPITRRLLPVSVLGELEQPIIETKPRIPSPFIERAKPIILPLTLQPGEEDIAVISIHLARNNGSRLVVMRILNEKLKTRVDYDLERFIKDTAEDAGVPCEYIDIHAPHTITESVKETAEKISADTIIVPVSRNLFLGGWRAIQTNQWIKEITNKKIILASSPPKQENRPHAPFRILIPVLHEFHQGPFDLSGSLTSFSVIPDVDIIAAKVIEFPSNVPLYSLYYPESMISKNNQFPFLQRSSMHALLRSITPLTLFVQDVSHGIANFIAERKVQMIIMDGDWSAQRNGFLRKEERKLAKNVRCTIIVTLQPSNS